MKLFKLKTTKMMALAVVLFAGTSQLIACGMNAPTTESIEDHIFSPTGNVDSISLKTAFQQVESGVAPMPSAQASGGSTALPPMPTDGPTGTSTQPLKAQQYLSLTPQNTMAKAGVPKPAIMFLQPQLLLKKQADVKAGQPVGDLLPKNIDNPMACLKNADLTSKNLDVTLEMSCMVKGGSGSIHVLTNNIGLSDLSKEPEELKGQISVRFNNACAEGNCINGHYRMDLDMSKSAQRVKLVLGYNVTVTQSNKSITSKGGLRVKLDAQNKEGQVDLVIFAKDKDGHEGSIVVSFQGNKESASFSVKGANGSFSCKASSDGNGQCTATDSDTKISWSL